MLETLIVLVLVLWLLGLLTSYTMGGLLHVLLLVVVILVVVRLLRARRLA